MLDILKTWSMADIFVRKLIQPKPGSERPAWTVCQAKTPTYTHRCQILFFFLAAETFFIRNRTKGSLVVIQVFLGFGGLATTLFICAKK